MDSFILYRITEVKNFSSYRIFEKPKSKSPIFYILLFFLNFLIFILFNRNPGFNKSWSWSWVRILESRIADFLFLSPGYSAILPIFENFRFFGTFEYPSIYAREFFGVLKSRFQEYPEIPEIPHGIQGRGKIPSRHG